MLHLSQQEHVTSEYTSRSTCDSLMSEKVRDLDVASIRASIFKYMSYLHLQLAS